MSTLKTLLGIGDGNNITGIPINHISQIANAPTLYSPPDSTVWLKAGNIAYPASNYPNAIPVTVGLQGLYNPISVLVKYGGYWGSCHSYTTDGTKLVLAFSSGLYIYNLSTPFDVETALFRSQKVSGLISGSANYLDSTGTYYQVVTGSTVYGYILTTPFDASTAISNGSISLTSGSTTSWNGMWFSPTGNKLYLVSAQEGKIFQYTLSTPWLVSSAINPISKSTVWGTPYGVFFKPDGLGYYITDVSNALISQYVLTTAWDLSTGTGSQFKLSSITGTDIKNLNITANGLTLILWNDGYKKYTLGTAWDISTIGSPTTITTTLITLTHANPQGFWFKPDGLKLFINQAGLIAEYALSIAFNINTMTLIKQGIFIHTSSNSLFFKDDGLTLYTTYNSIVHTYSLSVAWDISTLATARTTTLAEDSQSFGVFFKPDGTRMWIGGKSINYIHQYDLSTPWDTSTAIYNGKRVFALQHAGGICVTSDGGYLLGTYITGNYIRGHKLTTPWDISASSVENTASLSSTTGNGTSQIWFNPSNDRLYALSYDIGKLAVYDYSPFIVGLSSATGLEPNSYVRIK